MSNELLFLSLSPFFFFFLHYFLSLLLLSLPLHYFLSLFLSIIKGRRFVDGLTIRRKNEKLLFSIPPKELHPHNLILSRFFLLVPGILLTLPPSLPLSPSLFEATISTLINLMGNDQEPRFAFFVSLSQNASNDDKKKVKIALFVP